MTSPLEQPSYADLVQQISDLRTQIAQPLTLDDLPLGDLRGALIENGPPLDLNVAALDHSVGLQQLQKGVVFEVSVAGLRRKVAYGVAVAASGATTAIPHGLLKDDGTGLAPVWVNLTPHGNNGTNFGTLVISTFDATNVNVYQNSGVSENVHWIAIGELTT